MGGKGGSPENIVLNPLHWVQFATHAKTGIKRLINGKNPCVAP
jgi:hypothetical protein